MMCRFSVIKNLKVKVEIRTPKEKKKGVRIVRKNSEMLISISRNAL